MLERVQVLHSVAPASHSCRPLAASRSPSQPLAAPRSPWKPLEASRSLSKPLEASHSLPTAALCAGAARGCARAEAGGAALCPRRNHRRALPHRHPPCLVLNGIAKPLLRHRRPAPHCRRGRVGAVAGGAGGGGGRLGQRDRGLARAAGGAALSLAHARTACRQGGGGGGGGGGAAGSAAGPRAGEAAAGWGWRKVGARRPLFTALPRGSPVDRRSCSRWAARWAAEAAGRLARGDASRSCPPPSTTASPAR